MNLYNLCIVLLFAGSVVIFKIRHYIRSRKELKRRLEIGKIGEEETIQNLERIRGCKQILRNLYVPIGRGTETTEIDAVMIHEKGIFIIENKNYAGQIYGDVKDHQWTQIQRQNGKIVSRCFYNPVRQNQTHINCLKRLLTTADLKSLPKAKRYQIPYVSVITFNDRARLRRIKIRSEAVLVSESRKVRRRLRWNMFWMRRVLARKQVEELGDALRMFENPGKRTKRQHRRHLL